MVHKVVFAKLVGSNLQRHLSLAHGVNEGFCLVRVPKSSTWHTQDNSKDSSFTKGVFTKMWTGSRKPTKDVITPQGKKKRVQRGEGRKDCVGSKGQSHLEQVTL